MTDKKIKVFEAIDKEAFEIVINEFMKNHIVFKKQFEVLLDDKNDCMIYVAIIIYKEYDKRELGEDGKPK